MFGIASSNFAAYVITGIALFFALVWFFQWLWNITIPQVFNLKTITYWQALRLLIIAALLFGGANFNFG